MIMEKGDCLKIMVFLMIFLSFNIVSSVTIEFNARQGENINIFEKCSVNGFPCDSNYRCNITIRNPNEKVIILNKGMTRNDTIYNFTLNTSQIKDIGTFQYISYCTNGELNGTSEKYFKVTPSGEDLDISKSIIYVIVLIASVLLFVVCLYIGIILPWKNTRDEHGLLIAINYKKYLKLFLFVFSYMILIWIVNILVGISNNFLTLGISATFFRVIYFFLLSFSLLIMPLGFVILFLSIANDIRTGKLLGRGIRT